MNKVSKIYQIGTWKFNSGTGVLESNQETKILPKLLNHLLLLLIQRNQQLVSREELVDILWKDKYVNEDALSRAIAELRKALHDSASRPKFIKTLPKKGYQFIQQVEDVEVTNQHKRKTFNLLFIISLSIALILVMINYFKGDNKFTKLTLAVSEAYRITAEQGMENQPNLSPDGTKIAYRNRHGNKSNINIYDINQKKSVLTINKDNFLLTSPIFSHSGDKLIMSLVTANSCQLMLKNIKTLEERIFASCVIKSESTILEWTPDDSAIIVSDKEHKYGTAALWKVDVNSFEKQQITFPDSVDTFDVSPKVSPNGQYLSFSRGNHTLRNIYLQKFDGKKEEIAVALTKNTHYTVSHEWFDDQNIIMDSDQSGERQLWLLNIETGQSKLLGARGAQFPTIDALQNKLSYQISHFEANIWMFDINTQTEKLIINSTKYDNNPAFSASGKQFAFTSNRHNNGVIWMYDFETEQESKLFEISGAKLTRPVWSSDGKKLLATVNNKQGLWSYVFDIQTGIHKKLQFSMENYAAIYIDDAIYAMSKPVGGKSTILKLDAYGKMLQLKVNGISRFMSLSNNYMVISKANKKGLYLVDKNGLNEMVLVEGFPANALNHWTTSQSDIYYLNTDNNVDKGIWKINSKTLIKEKITNSYPYSVGPSLSVSSDQSKILITKTDRAESDVFVTHLNK